MRHGRRRVAAVLLGTGLVAPNAAAAPAGAPVWQVAIAHDFHLPGDDPPVHYYPPAAAQFDTTGVLRAFGDGGAVTWDLPVGHSGNDGIIAWGRWGHGSTGGDGRHGGVDITGGEGVRNAIYYVAGSTPEVLQGAARYSLLGGQVAPTAGEGGMAATTFLENGALEADFGTGKITLKLAITVPSGRYDLTASGLHIDGARISMTADSRLQVTGVLCFAGCAATLHGFFAGADGERVGLAYNIDIEALSEDMNGVVAWRRD